MQLDEALLELKRFKIDVREHLLKAKYIATSKTDQLSQEEIANKMFKYLETTIENVIKRKSLNFKFHPGGSPDWYATIFKIISKWIELETKVDELMRKQLNV